MKIKFATTSIFSRNFHAEKPVVVNIGGARSSKCLERGTEIVMASGRLKRVEDIIVGDQVMGIDSTSRTVLECHSGIGQLYQVHQSKGIDYIVNENHILTLQRSADAKRPYGELTKAGTPRHPNGRYISWGNDVEIPIKEYLQQSARWKRSFYGYRIGIEFPENPIGIDPYFLGLWLGDGHQHNQMVTTADQEIKDYLCEYAETLRMKVTYHSKQETTAQSISITYGIRKGHGRSSNKLLKLLKRYNVINNKHIPSAYLYNSRDVRLQVLAGLVDSDGGLHKNGYTITQKNKRLAEQIYYLASSLGFRTSFIPRIAKLKSRNYSCEVFTVTIYGNIQEIPCKVVRKQVPENYVPSFTPSQTGIKVEPVHIGEYHGFTLDGDGLFLLKDFTVVHNSFSLLQLLIYKLLNEKNKKILVARKTLPSLRITAYKVFVDLLKEYKLYDWCEHNKTERIITYNTNMVYFTGIDDPEKIRSSEWNYAFMEEANEFSYNDFTTVKMRMSGATLQDQPNRVYLALNPSDEFGWINQTLSHQEDVQIIRSNWEDNPFLAKEYIQILLDLRKTDPNLYKIYALGEWGKIDNLIFRNWTVTDPTNFPQNYDNHFYGLDFGYNNPSALVEIFEKDQEYYLQELLYQTHLTNQDLIERLQDLAQKDDPIYADSAEPARIKELSDAGFMIYPAEKNVKDGLDFVKRHKLYVSSGSENMIKELRSYKWKEDKDGNVLDEPVKFRDHICDSARYGIFTHMRKNESRITVLSGLGSAYRRG